MHVTNVVTKRSSSVNACALFFHTHSSNDVSTRMSIFHLPRWIIAVAVVFFLGCVNIGGMQLAVIEFAWSAAVMLLEKTDLQGWTSALVRKIMWIGAFYALLLNGATWIPAIIDSFNQIGANAAGIWAGARQEHTQ